MLESLKTVRLSGRICEVLKKLIIEEGFKPGDKFFSQNELAAKLQVSISSVREAVRILEATGWVRVEHGKGIYIVNSTYQGFEAFASWLKTNEIEILEHFEVRLMIDPKAAAYAARNAEAEDIQALEKLCEEFYSRADKASTEEMIKLDEQLHAAIAKSTKNKTLAVLMKTMTRVLPEGWISSLHVPGRVHKTIEEHRRIVESIKNHDPEGAEKAMVEHLTKALQEIRASIQRDGNAG